MEEERWVLEVAVRVGAKRHSKAEAMRVERERQVETEWRAAKEEAVRTEAERRSIAMKHTLDFSFRLCPIKFSLKFSFRLCKIDFSLKFSFRSTFQISGWLQIAFIFISDW